MAKSKVESAAVLAQRAKCQKDSCRTLGHAIKALRAKRRAYAKELAEIDGVLDNAVKTWRKTKARLAHAARKA